MHGHDAGDDGDLDSGQIATVAEVVEVAVVEEHLGDDEVGAGVGFGFEVVHLGHAVWCAGVSFWESGDADAEAAGVGVPERLGLILDKRDELGGVAKAFFPPVVCGFVWWVATEREDVGHTSLGVGGEQIAEFVLGLLDAGHVGDGVEPGLVLGAQDEVTGEFSGGAAGAVGDGDVGRTELFEPDHAFVERLGGFFGARREELERERGRALLEKVLGVGHRRFRAWVGVFVQAYRTRGSRAAIWRCCGTLNLGVVYCLSI